jgi:hypothetical protein
MFKQIQNILFTVYIATENENTNTEIKGKAKLLG